jgi:hypothetical protein
VTCRRLGSTRVTHPPPKEGTIKGQEAPKSGTDNMVRDPLAAQALAPMVDMARKHLVCGDLAASTMGWVPCC